MFRGTEWLQAFDLVCAHMFLAFASLKVFQQLLVARAHLIVGALFAVPHCRKPLAGKKSLPRLLEFLFATVLISTGRQRAGLDNLDVRYA